MVRSSSLMPCSSDGTKAAKAASFVSLFSFLKKSISPAATRRGRWSASAASAYSYPIAAAGRNAAGALGVSLSAPPFSLRFPR